MLRLRKSDIPKAIVLIVAIVGVAVFGIWNVTRFTRTTRPVPRRAQTTPEAGAAATPAGAEMFAPRQAGVANLLGQARIAPDPFRPSVSFSARTTPTVATPAAAPKEKPPTRVRPLPALPGEEVDRTTLEVVGIVTGTSTLAVLGDGKQRYYVRDGDKVVDGWYVAAIHTTSVTVSKGKTQVTLPLVVPPP